MMPNILARAAITAVIAAIEPKAVLDILPALLIITSEADMAISNSVNAVIVFTMESLAFIPDRSATIRARTPTITSIEDNDLMRFVKVIENLYDSKTLLLT